MPSKREAGVVSWGVRPPCAYQAWPTVAVNPAASMLMAAPETIWLPRASIDAKPCARPNTTDATMPAASPIQAFPVP